MKLAVLALSLFLAACAGVDPSPTPASAPHLTDEALIAADGARLPLHKWLPQGEPKAVIVALHGFGDYGNFFALPGPKFAQAGIAVFAYDQRGFGAAPDPGRWAGEQAMRGDLYAILPLLAERYPGKPLYVLGESMGGAVAMTALSHPAIDQVLLPKLAGVILVAPAVWSRDQMPWYQDLALWLGAHTLPWLTVSGRGVVHIRPSDNIEMLRRYSRDPLVIKETRLDAIKGLCDLMDHATRSASGLTLPGMILIPDHDEVIPAPATQAVLAVLPPAIKPRSYPDGYHMLLRDLHADLPIDDVIAWIKGTE